MAIVDRGYAVKDNNNELIGFFSVDSADVVNDKYTKITWNQVKPNSGAWTYPRPWKLAADYVWENPSKVQPMYYGSRQREFTFDVSATSPIDAIVQPAGGAVYAGTLLPYLAGSQFMTVFDTAEVLGSLTLSNTVPPSALLAGDIWGFTVDLVGNRGGDLNNGYGLPSYVSSDPTIATVDTDSVVRSLKNGTVTITVSLEGKSDTFDITFQRIPKITAIGGKLYSVGGKLMTSVNDPSPTGGTNITLSVLNKIDVNGKQIPEILFSSPITGLKASEVIVKRNGTAILQSFGEDAGVWAITNAGGNAPAALGFGGETIVDSLDEFNIYFISPEEYVAGDVFTLEITKEGYTTNPVTILRYVDVTPGVVTEDVTEDIWRFNLAFDNPNTGFAPSVDMVLKINGSVIPFEDDLAPIQWSYTGIIGETTSFDFAISSLATNAIANTDVITLEFLIVGWYVYSAPITLTNSF